MNKQLLSEKSVLKNPFLQFDKWYKEHLSGGSGILDSVYLGTASSNGKVSVRTVLLKDYGKQGFIFFTNYGSKKGLQLHSNNNAALLFYWPEKNRQVRIEGVAGKLSPELSDAYFAKRPIDNQLGAWASNQGEEIPSRDYLEQRLNYFRKIYAESAVSRPRHWGGYMITPYWFEFWEDRENRLHDRITYTRKDDEWVIARLAP